jgi:hypothetical protein
MGQGNTPLIQSSHTASLFFKLENCNPSGSYKDRFVAAEVADILAGGSRLMRGYFVRQHAFFVSGLLREVRASMLDPGESGCAGGETGADAGARRHRDAHSAVRHFTRRY